MKIKFTVGLIIIALVVSINSCENKGAVPFKPCNADTTGLTYSSGSNTMAAIINTQCGVNNSSCHSAGGGASGYDYTSYYGIYSNFQNGYLQGALFGNGSLPMMPLAPQSGWSDSSSCMLEKFNAWIARGCPQ